MVLFESPPTTGPELIVARRAGAEVNSAYFASYTDELDAGVVTDLRYLNSPGISGGTARDLPYGAFLRALEVNGVADVVLGSRPDRLVELRSNPDVVASIVSVTRARVVESPEGPPAVPEAEPQPHW